MNKIFVFEEKNMSIYYTVKEHFSIKNTAGFSDIIDLIADHFSQIGERLPSKNSFVIEFKLIADNKAYSFNDKELLNTLKKAKSIDYTMHYEYRNDDCDNVGPFEICDFIESKLENDETATENVFFSMYNSADCEPGAGVLCAFGIKNGVLYNGVLQPAPSELPENGAWITPDTCVVFDDALTESMNPEQIKECAEAFSEMGDHTDVDFRNNPNGISLFVNYLELQSKKDFESFIEISKKLLSATDGKAGVSGEFVDLDSEDAKILVIDFEESGSYSVKSTAL